MTVRWVLEKKEINSNIGITFGGPKSDDGNAVHPVFIWTVKGGRMKKIDIIPGLRVSKICDHWVRNAEQANRLVKLAPPGPVPVETYGKYYPVEKTTKDEKAGLALNMTKFPLALPNGLRAIQEVVEITKVNPNGMYPEIAEGHILWGINGTKITTMKQAIKLLRKKRSLRLVVLDPETLDSTVKSIVDGPNASSSSYSSSPTSTMPSEEPMPHDDGDKKDVDKDPTASTTATPGDMPSSPVMTVLEKSFDLDEDSASIYDDETTLLEGDEEFETGPALWC
ncbi:unnamed protein product [Cylindrotheca closterium]|uniref:PDZ domain-containing protein n=1 Tax=Cylindrotheca closterium TaxID=2856 RepID=A0AAD2FVJ2_9STRA|nr:unnamed protein product [Cylindrotheca closterium]